MAVAGGGRCSGSGLRAVDALCVVSRAWAGAGAGAGAGADGH